MMSMQVDLMDPKDKDWNPGLEEMIAWCVQVVSEEPWLLYKVSRHQGDLCIQVRPRTDSAMDSWKPGSEEDPGGRKEQRRQSCPAKAAMVASHLLRDQSWPLKVAKSRMLRGPRSTFLSTCVSRKYSGLGFDPINPSPEKIYITKKSETHRVLCSGESVAPRETQA